MNDSSFEALAYAACARESAEPVAARKSTPAPSTDRPITSWFQVIPASERNAAQEEHDQEQVRQGRQFQSPMPQNAEVIRRNPLQLIDQAQALARALARVEDHSNCRHSKKSNSKDAKKK